MAVAKNEITENQYSYIIHSSMIGIGILSLAEGTSQKAHQQGWIAVLIGGIYPLFIVFSSYYIDKKMNHAYFYELNKKLYGKFMAYIITFFFLINFIIMEASVLSGFTNVLLTFIVNFIPPSWILIITILVTVYVSINGLTEIGRLCEIFFYLILILVAIFIIFIPRGSIANVKPYFSSVSEIISAVPTSLYAYAGVELSFIAIPFISKRKSTLKAGIKGVASVILVYTFTVFMAIYLLGWEMCSRIARPLIYMLSTIQIPVIEDLRIVFLFLWSGVILKIIPSLHFGVSHCFSSIFNIDYKKSCIITPPYIFILSLFMIPEYNRRKLMDQVIVYMVSGITIWALISLIVVLLKKRGEKH